MTRRRERPALPWDDSASQAKFAKPQYREAAEPTDTRSLAFRKIHPERDLEYRRWLRFRDCRVKGRIDLLTDQPHICWNPDERFKADPAHTGKAYSGALKRSDIPSEYASGMLSLCRHAHRMQESNMDEFDRRFGINRHGEARAQHAEYIAEKERAL